MIKTIVIFLFSIFICINLNAGENEVISYSTLKYKIDFDKQNSQLKDSLNQEYNRVKKIAQILEPLADYKKQPVI